jgi:hypothetical protein
MHNTRTCSDVVQKKIADTKEVIRYRKSKKERQCNDKTEKDKQRLHRKLKTEKHEPY